MKPSLLDKLQQLADRLEEVTHLLGSPEATAATAATSPTNIATIGAAN